MKNYSLYMCLFETASRQIMLSNAYFDVLFLLGAKLSVSVCWCQIVNFLILVSNCPILLS